MKAAEHDSPLLAKEDAIQYRALAARLNYLVLDRLDLQFAAKEVSKHMPHPKEQHVVLLKRVGRYLRQSPRLIQWFDWQYWTNSANAYTDSDWAGDVSTCKSTSGGAIIVGRHLIKSWFSSQQIVALSSAEAELYAMLKGVAQVLGIASLAADFGDELVCNLSTDASAALAISQRMGLGKLRHINVQWLWIQERVKSRDLKVHKVIGTQNPADLFTKHLAYDLCAIHVEFLSLERRSATRHYQYKDD